jgi:hypothetical protein
MTQVIKIGGVLPIIFVSSLQLKAVIRKSRLGRSAAFRQPLARRTLPKRNSQPGRFRAHVSRRSQADPAPARFLAGSSVFRHWQVRLFGPLEHPADTIFVRKGPIGAKRHFS